MTEATEPKAAPMTPEYTGEFTTTKPTLASLTLDHLLRATFQNAELTAQLANLRARAAAADDFEKSCTLARNYAVELQGRIDRLLKESSDAERLLAELWDAADAASKIRSRNKAEAEILLRLRRAVAAAAIDCGQIPF